jgi:hypothetical protein
VNAPTFAHHCSSTRIVPAWKSIFSQRSASSSPPGRGDTVVFAAVPAAEVEDAAAGHRHDPVARGRAFEYEKKARTGRLLSEWYDGRRNMIMVQDALRNRIMPMVFQENVAADEIRRYRDDLRQFRELFAQAELELEERMKRTACARRSRSSMGWPTRTGARTRTRWSRCVGGRRCCVPGWRRARRDARKPLTEPAPGSALRRRRGSAPAASQTPGGPGSRGVSPSARSS